MSVSHLVLRLAVQTPTTYLLLLLFHQYVNELLCPYYPAYDY